jgi:hypothetical protein
LEDGGIKNSTFPCYLSADFRQYSSEPSNRDGNNQPKCQMNQQPKTEKKPKTKNKAQVHDLKPKKDAKGGDGPTETITFNYSKPHVQY